MKYERQKMKRKEKKRREEKRKASVSRRRRRRRRRIVTYYSTQHTVVAQLPYLPWPAVARSTTIQHPTEQFFFFQSLPFGRSDRLEAENKRSAAAERMAVASCWLSFIALFIVSLRMNNAAAENESRRQFEFPHFLFFSFFFFFSWLFSAAFAPSTLSRVQRITNANDRERETAAISSSEAGMRWWPVVVVQFRNNVVVAWGHYQAANDSQPTCLPACRPLSLLMRIRTGRMMLLMMTRGQPTDRPTLYRIFNYGYFDAAMQCECIM